MNFAPTVSISFLLLSIAYLAHWPLLSAPLWLIGVTLQTIFVFHIISVWITHEFEIHHFNPAWFIPVVGNILVPVAGVEFAPVPVSAFYFGAGIFFWIILSSIIIYRLIFHKTMPQKLMPTLFIFMAPPAVGFISYMRITMSYDFFSQFMLFLGFFIFVMLGFLFGAYRKTPFFLSWWAYTFPVAAVTISSIIAFQITKFSTFKYFSWLGMSILIGVVSVVGLFTIKNIINKSICVKED
jgi:tellurite resistance protein